jgi:hypothetical protein
MKKIQLSIPKPCQENWDAMTPREQGRFCGSCQKTVVDFSTMSDRQIAEFFKRPLSSVCGRFVADQLDRDIALPKKRIPWIRYFFQISLPAFLLSAKAQAQGRVVVKGDTICASPSVPDHAKAPIDTSERTITGKITDENGNPIPFPSIVIKGTDYGVAANEKGEFTLTGKLGNLLIISSVGFESREYLITSSSYLNISLKLVHEKFITITMGAIVTTTHKKELKPVPLIKKIADTAFKNFSIYPNPALNNSYLKLDLSKLEKGDYIVALIDMNGDIQQTEEHKIGEKKKIVDFYLRDIASGTYVVHLFNIKTAASFSEKIIIH